MSILVVYLMFIAAASAADAANANYFVENVGQWDGDFSFKCEVGSTIYYVTPQGVTVDFREVTETPLNPPARRGGRPELESVSVRGHVVQIHYGEASSEARPRGEGRLPHYSNYFLSRDSTKWKSRIGHFENVVVPEVWTGIDVEYRADKQGVETIYHVQPGADPAQIQMECLGLDQPLRIDAHGNLILATSLGDLKEQAPYSYQQQGRVQQKITSSVRLLGENRVGFDLGEYDRAKELVIDPLLYGTYLGGGAQDDSYAVTPAPEGGVYVTGSTEALSGFPTTPGAYDETGLFVGRRLFCSHFGPNGEFIASTLLGEIQTSENPNTDGSMGDLVYDSLRNSIWLCGAGQTDWPVTPDAFDTIGDDLYDGVILRLSEDLTTLEYCTYLGGGGGDATTEIEIDNSSRVFVTGLTSSIDFPVTPDALYPESIGGQDCFLCVIDPTSNEILFSSYFGGSLVDWDPDALQITDDGYIWIVTQTESPDIPVTENAFQQTLADTSLQLGDVMIAGLSLAPPAVEYCSYLGGKGWDQPYALSLSDSVLFIAGQTMSQDFPVSADAFDTIGWQTFADNEGFVASLNWRTGEYRGTYIGGSGVDRIVKNDFGVRSESLTLLGVTTSTDFPITEDAYQPVPSGDLDGFVIKISHDLTRSLYGTYLGGSEEDEYRAAWVENEDSLWIVGLTLSIDFPTTPNAIQPGDNGLTSGFVQHFAIDTTADTTDAVEHREIPTEFSLTVFPNPFNPTTTLSFDLQHTADVKILIHDVLGRVVERLDLGTMNTGSHAIRIGNNDWASGIYFATVSTKTHLQTTKLLLLR